MALIQLMAYRLGLVVPLEAGIFRPFIEKILKRFIQVYQFLSMAATCCSTQPRTLFFLSAVSYITVDG